MFLSAIWIRVTPDMFIMLLIYEDDVCLTIKLDGLASRCHPSPKYWVSSSLIDFIHYWQCNTMRAFEKLSLLPIGKTLAHRICCSPFHISLEESTFVSCGNKYYSLSPGGWVKGRQLKSWSRGTSFQVRPSIPHLFAFWFLCRARSKATLFTFSSWLKSIDCFRHLTSLFSGTIIFYFIFLNTQDCLQAFGGGVTLLRCCVIWII